MSTVIETPATHDTAAGLRRKGWVRPFRRAHRALDASVHLICRTLLTAGASSRRAHRRPIQSSRELAEASGLLIQASTRLNWAWRELAEASACAAREPGNAGEVTELLLAATERCVYMAGWLQESAEKVVTLQEDVLEGLRTGNLVPERPADHRPRIVLVAPRPAPIRAFLRLRQPRAVDRVAPLLQRRRRTPRPAALRVPRRSVLGRAPPSVSCLL